MFVSGADCLKPPQLSMVLWAAMGTSASAA